MYLSNNLPRPRWNEVPMCTLHTIQCTLYNTHYTLYSVHRTLRSVEWRITRGEGEGEGGGMGGVIYL